MSLMPIANMASLLAEPPDVTFIQMENANGTYTIDLGQNDTNRHLVIAQAQFSGGVLGTPIAPTIGGIDMSTAISRGNGISSDGHQGGIFYKHIPSGGTVDVTVSNGQADPQLSMIMFYRMVGVAPGSTPFSTEFADGDGVTLALPTKGCAFALAVQNFVASAHLIDNCDSVLTRPNTAASTSVLVGAAKSIPVGNTFAATNHTNPIHLTLAATFQFV